MKTTILRIIFVFSISSCYAGAALAAQTGPSPSPDTTLKTTPGTIPGPEVPDEPSDGEIAPGLLKEQPKRRRLYGARDEEQPAADDPQPADDGREKPLVPIAPIPPYPNYPQSVLPKPPRTPRQQEYLYLNHIYFDPLALAIGGFVSFGWIGMISSGKALGVGLDIYSPRTNLSIVLQNKQDDADYIGVTALLLRLGFHFFIEPNQLKGFDFGIISRTGFIVSPASGNAVILQESLELSFYYRFVVSFYARSGRPALSIGIAPYITFALAGYLPTSQTIAILRDSDDGFDEYLNVGNLINEPSVLNDIDPLAIKLSFRFGFEVSIIF